jgi:hypothetical protein
MCSRFCPNIKIYIDTWKIMDGSPSRGETIPIRLFLGGFDLTPTFREVNKKYSTRYYLSLVLIDEGKLLHFLSLILRLMSSRCTTLLQTVRNRTLPSSTRIGCWRRAADPDCRRTPARESPDPASGMIHKYGAPEAVACSL